MKVTIEAIEVKLARGLSGLTIDDRVPSELEIQDWDDHYVTLKAGDGETFLVDRGDLVRAIDFLKR
jgi:hypothetical protein